MVKARIPVAWAMASRISTPGNTGLAGKWPWKIGSLNRDVLDGARGLALIADLVVFHLVHHQERITVGQQIHDFLDAQALLFSSQNSTLYQS